VQAAITQASPLLPPGPSPRRLRFRSRESGRPARHLSFYSASQYAASFTALKRIRRHTHGAALLHGQWASPKCKSSVLKNTRFRVQVNPDKLASRGIGIDEVEAAVSQPQTSTFPQAHCTAANRMMTIHRHRTTHPTPKPSKNIIVAYSRGPRRSAWKRSQTVLDSVEDDKAAAWLSTFEIHRTFPERHSLQAGPAPNAVEVSNGGAQTAPEKS